MHDAAVAAVEIAELLDGGVYPGIGIIIGPAVTVEQGEQALTHLIVGGDARKHICCLQGMDKQVGQHRAFGRRLLPPHRRVAGLLEPIPAGTAVAKDRQHSARSGHPSR